MTVLDDLVKRARKDARKRAEKTPLQELEKRLADRPEPRPFAEALAAQPGVSVIAEHKRRSPSEGVLREDDDVAGIVRAYDAAGAAALSVLTDRKNFGGRLADLVAARAAVPLPVLRKDFVVDEYQVIETAVYGADAMLLIVAALEDDELRGLHRLATDLELDVLVEVHDEEELERALEVADADVIGVNNRDLRDLSVDLQRTHDLLADVPAGKVVVSESGIAGRQQIEELERVGVDAVLVGSHLMRAADPGAALRELVGD